jgi:hypothetical protein
VLDVFNLLREFPKDYFADPAASHLRDIRAALRPVFKGNRTRVAKNRTRVRALIRKFSCTYREVMNTAETWLKEYYGSKANMRLSISSRAAFENKPIELYRTTLYKEFDDAIGDYKSTGNADLICQLVARNVSTSLRKVEALLVQGRCRRLSHGGFELEMQTIDGIDYSIRAWNNRKQRRCLQVSVAVKRAGYYFRTPLPDQLRLTSRQIKSLRYQFTTDGWANTHIVGTHLEKDAAGRLVISANGISNLPLIGRLQGVFFVGETGNSSLARDEANGSGYTFAVPDKQELATLISGIR